jgi:hypothetical protein
MGKVNPGIAELRNLGPVTQRRLAEVGIATEAELRRVGAEEAWRRLRFAFGKDVTLNALYALEGRWSAAAGGTCRRKPRIACGAQRKPIGGG